ncbi:MAG: two-component system invasion response regulator UvrY [Candidatus Marinamargulisbacteria bacterium]|jgi:two-component system invasion response regulator UvrY
MCIKICIVDDHEIFRRGLSQIVDAEPDMKVVAQAVDYASFFRILETGKVTPDVVVLDVSLPGGKNGQMILSKIMEQTRPPKVMVLTMYADPHFGLTLLRQGAAGYLTKESDPGLVVESIRRVAGGKRVMPDAVTELMLGGNRKTESPLHHALSGREFQVFMCLSNGQTVGDTAISIGVNIKTVSTYRSRILTKLQLTNNMEIIRYGLNHNLASR